MCDVEEVKRLLDEWLIPEVVQVKCEIELRFPGDPSYDATLNDNGPYHYTLVTLKTPLCVCGEDLPEYCACAIWEDLGAHDVDGEWALSSLGDIEVSAVRQSDWSKSQTKIEYFW